MMVKVFDMFEDGQSAGRVPLPAMTYRLDTFGKLIERQIVANGFRDQIDGKPKVKFSRGPKEMRYVLCDDHSHYFICERADGVLRHAELIESKLCDKSCQYPKFFEGIDTDLHISYRAGDIFRKERRRLTPQRIKDGIRSFLRSLVTGHAY